MFSPKEIIRIIIRRRWLLIIPFCIAISIGCVLAFTLPKIFQSSTLILVEPQRVPSSYVQSVVSLDISSRLRTISEQVMSRTNLERIIDTYRMFSEPEYADMFLEDKIDIIRRRIKVNVKQSSTFSISFKGQNPEKVKNVANALATYFIDENLKVREAQAVGTSVFLDDELETMRQRLEESEGRMRAYRQKFIGELPEQLQSNLSVLNRYSEALIEKQKALREAKANSIALQKQISQAQEAKVSSQGGDDTLLKAPQPSDIEVLKERLASLKTRYTDRHPDVLRLQGIINKMEADMAGDEEVIQPTTGTTPEPGKTKKKVSQQDIASLRQTQLYEYKQQIELMEADTKDLQKKIDIYQKRVENTPKREEELLAIKRDYENTKKMYESLLNRRLEAEISVNMEKKQKGEQFRIIDPARLPQKPISPNMTFLFIGTLGMGLGLGAALVLLMEFLDTSYRNKDDVEATLELSVLAAVPSILQPNEKRRARLEMVLSTICLCLSAGMLACFAVITAKGPEKIIAIVKHYV